MNQVNESKSADVRVPARSSRAAAKRLNFAIGYFATVFGACLLMMWGVFNSWLNILQYRADATAEPKVELDWSMAALVVLATCVVPFLIGLVLLFKTLGSTKLTK